MGTERRELTLVTIALDTNVLLRIILNDDSTQLAKALSALKSETGYVQDTVILELEWILRSYYKFSVEQVNGAMKLLVQNEDIKLEDAGRLQAALAAYEAGVEFTDAYHVAGATIHARFLTFDKDLAKRASRIFDTPKVIEP
jgi:predicted nucleic-acid-binding protein